MISVLTYVHRRLLRRCFKKRPGSKLMCWEVLGSDVVQMVLMDMGMMLE